MKIFLQHRNITNILLYSFSILIFILFYFPYFAQAQEEIITIVPGSSDSSRYRFFDITEYPIRTGEEIKWYNADDVTHNIIIFSTNGKDILAKSENIKPHGFFSYIFENVGEYLFQSPKYDWMKGKIIVTNDIKTVKKSMVNDIDLYLSWTPSSINVGKKVFFKIMFIDSKREKNQEHIDYSFTIRNSTSDNLLYKNTITHTAWGIEPASYVFNSSGIYNAKIGIEGILFQPIEPDYSEFKISVNK